MTVAGLSLPTPRRLPFLVETMPKAERARNLPCSCGSGKPFKKCCRDKKPRIDRAIAVSKPVGQTFPDGKIPPGLWTITHSPQGPRINVAGKDVAMEPGFQLQTVYEREGKRDKVLRQMPVESLEHIRGLQDPGAILRHATAFHHIFVIDTNTKMVGETARSAGVSLSCRIALAEDPNPQPNGRIQMAFHFNLYTIFQYEGLSAGEAEKRAVADLVDSIQKHPSYRPTQRIAIVTDHDLGSHIMINARDKPLWGRGMLPPNFTLVYASADGGKENVLNRAMALCDSTATEVLQKVPKPTSTPSADRPPT